MTGQIAKTLSANDVGETGGHQAGILVPKAPSILAFFPTLNAETKNPRLKMAFKESESGSPWSFNFIYYNNAFFGGTRNEYRLTGMTGYLRSVNAKKGDTIVFFRDGDWNYSLAIKRAHSMLKESSSTLVLSGGWKVISI